MSCEQCSVNFTIFKRKKMCMICRRHHCSNCLPKEPSKPSNQRRCGKCRELSANPSRADLQKFRVKDLKLYLTGRSVAMDHCTEKNDLVELVLKYNNSAEYWQQEAESRQRTNEMMSNLRDNFSTPTSEPSSTSENTSSPAPPPSQRPNDTTSSSQRQNDATLSQPPSDTTSSDRPNQPNSAASANQNNFAEFSESRAQQLRERQEREMREAQQRLRAEMEYDERPDPRPARKFTTLNDVENEESIEDLTIKQLKEILTANFVDYKGCCEKRELVERVRRLWDDSNKNQQRVKDIYAEGTSDTGDGSGGGEHELCKICMDAIIDCVLLECGHMVTCTSCGRRLHECPICRNFVVRVVHTFKA